MKEEIYNTALEQKDDIFDKTLLLKKIEYSEWTSWIELNFNIYGADNGVSLYNDEFLSILVELAIADHARSIINNFFKRFDILDDDLYIWENSRLYKANTRLKKILKHVIGKQELNLKRLLKERNALLYMFANESISAEFIKELKEWLKLHDYDFIRDFEVEKNVDISINHKTQNCFSYLNSFEIMRRWIPENLHSEFHRWIKKNLALNDDFSHLTICIDVHLKWKNITKPLNINEEDLSDPTAKEDLPNRKEISFWEVLNSYITFICCILILWESYRITIPNFLFLLVIMNSNNYDDVKSYIRLYIRLFS